MNFVRGRSAMEWLACLALAVLLIGCDTLGKVTKFKNPVMPEPPPRIARANSEPGTPGNPSRDREPSGIVQVSAEEPGQTAGDDLALASGPPIFKDELRHSAGEVAALVNGNPIFMDDLLLPYTKGLAKAEKEAAKRGRLPEFQAQRRQLARQGLRGHIERQLLMQALKSKLKEEQITGIEKHLDEEFRNNEQKKMMRVYGVTSAAELDQELRKQGTSLATLRTTYRNQHMAQQFLASKAMPKTGMDRPDLLEYYQNHLEDYQYPGTVKWQQILLEYGKRSRDEAHELAEQILGELAAGASFDELARKYDEGPRARQGGNWDWTTEGNVKSSEVEQALFELPLGKASPIIETDDGINIVRAGERKPAGRKSFDEVQAEIKNQIHKEEFQESAQAILRELLENATIEVLIDEPEDGPSTVQPANFKKSAERY